MNREIRNTEGENANNYNLDIKNPHTKEEELGGPEELLTQYLQIQEELRNVRNQLKNELMESLGGH